MGPTGQVNEASPCLKYDLSDASIWVAGHASVYGKPTYKRWDSGSGSDSHTGRTTNRRKIEKDNIGEPMVSGSGGSPGWSQGKVGVTP